MFLTESKLRGSIMIKYKYRKPGRLSIFFACLTIFGTFTANGISGEVKSLTWNECVKTAELNNPDIISAKEKILQYAAERKIIRGDLLPQVTASASGGRSGYDSGITSDESINKYSYGLSAKQLIFDGFKSVYDLKSAGSGLEKVKLEYQVTSSEVRYNLRNAWINYIKAKEMLKIAEEIEARRKHIYELVKMRYNAGKEHIGSLHSVQADLMQSKAASAEALRALSLANTTLCLLLGYGESVQLSIDGTFDIALSYNNEPDFTAIALKSPSVLMASSAKESAYYSLKSSELDFSPKLYGSASIGRQGESMSEMSNEWSVGFEITAPLFEGGKSYYAVEKASAAHRQQRTALWARSRNHGIHLKTVSTILRLKKCR